MKLNCIFVTGYFNYFYGVMPISTNRVSVFKLEKYQEGILLRYPDSEVDLSKVGEFKENNKLKKALDEYNNIYSLLKVSTIHQLNTKIKENMKDVILLSEALHEKKIAELSSEILKKKDVKMILIAGPSSSGKTTFAGKLTTALRLSGIKPVMISVDNYFVERENTPLDEHRKL